MALPFATKYCCIINCAITWYTREKGHSIHFFIIYNIPTNPNLSNLSLPTDKIEKTNLSNIITETEKGIVCEKHTMPLLIIHYSNYNTLL